MFTVMTWKHDLLGADAAAFLFRKCHTKTNNVSSGMPFHYTTRLIGILILAVFVIPMPVDLGSTSIYNPLYKKPTRILFTAQCEAKVVIGIQMKQTKISYSWLTL